MTSRADLRVEHDLNEPLTVPKIDEDHPAVIPTSVGPAH
jgi:hypothetical protein